MNLEMAPSSGNTVLRQPYVIMWPKNFPEKTSYLALCLQSLAIRFFFFNHPPPKKQGDSKVFKVCRMNNSLSVTSQIADLHRRTIFGNCL